VYVQLELAAAAMDGFSNSRRSSKRRD